MMDGSRLSYDRERRMDAHRCHRSVVFRGEPTGAHQLVLVSQDFQDQERKYPFSLTDDLARHSLKTRSCKNKQF